MWDEVLLAAGVAAAISAAACRLLIAAGVTDRPDLPRKMHAAPTATSGGLGAAIGMLAGVAALTLPSARDWSWRLAPQDIGAMAGVCGVCVLFLFVGAYDDARPMTAKPKLAVFAVLSIVMALFAGAAQEIAIAPAIAIELDWSFGLAGSAVFVFVLVNIVNFVDGANGLAMGSAAIGLAALAACAAMAGVTHGAALALVGAGALAGLLLWNFPDGRLFAGDAGALFAGALCAGVALLAVSAGGVSVFTAATPFAPILTDGLLTLAARALARANLLEGHREHAFQLLLRMGVGVTRVTLFYWAGALLAGAAALSALVFEPHSGAPFVAFCGVTALFSIAWALIRGAARRRALL